MILRKTISIDTAAGGRFVFDVARLNPLDGESVIETVLRMALNLMSARGPKNYPWDADDLEVWYRERSPDDNRMGWEISIHRTYGVRVIGSHGPVQKHLPFPVSMLPQTPVTVPLLSAEVFMSDDVMKVQAAECQRLAREMAKIQNGGGEITARMATALCNALLNAGNTFEQIVRDRTTPAPEPAATV